MINNSSEREKYFQKLENNTRQLHTYNILMRLRIKEVTQFLNEMAQKKQKHQEARKIFTEIRAMKGEQKELAALPTEDLPQPTSEWAAIKYGKDQESQENSRSSKRSRILPKKIAAKWRQLRRTQESESSL